jgi:hypothetical protein
MSANRYSMINMYLMERYKNRNDNPKYAKKDFAFIQDANNDFGFVQPEVMDPKSIG